MLKLASFPEVQETLSGKEFVQKLKDRVYSIKFFEAYNEYMKKFGCRGMMEIGIASSRCVEDPAEFFCRIKQIDVASNQILNVKERKQEAYQKLLARIRCSKGY